MSVVKVRKPPGPFETVDRASVDAIRDISALGLWLYLRCKPEGWIVRETQVREHFGIGRDKYRACVRYLCQLGAMEDRRIQGERGRIIGRELVVHYAVSATDGFSVDREPENPAHGASDSAASGREPENPSDGDYRAPEKPVRRRKPSDGKSAHLENKDVLDITDELENKSRARGARLPLDTLPDDWMAFCRSKRPDLDPSDTWDRFRDYWIAQPGQRGCKADWYATWRNWVRNEKQGNGKPSGANQHAAHAFENKRYVGTPVEDIGWVD